MEQNNFLSHEPSEAEKWNSYYHEFADKSDRVTAIIGAAMLESALDKAIQHIMIFA